MPASKLAILVLVFFLTSLVSVVTGSTSLITVPVMIAAGIEPHIAVATNMLALILMSAGGTLPFAKRGVIAGRTLPIGIPLTVLGSILGALLLVRIPANALHLTIALAMIAVAVFSIAKGDSGETQASSASPATGYLATFLLAVYGGFFSGGYVTMLTSVFVVLLGLTFVQAIATTKVLNIFSSLVATVIFALRGLVDYKLGVILGLTMFVGALTGGHIALRISSIWLRRFLFLSWWGSPQSCWFPHRDCIQELKARPSRRASHYTWGKSRPFSVPFGRRRARSHALRSSPHGQPAPSRRC